MERSSDCIKVFHGEQDGYRLTGFTVKRADSLIRYTDCLRVLILNPNRSTLVAALDSDQELPLREFSLKGEKTVIRIQYTKCTLPYRSLALVLTLPS